MSLVKKAHLANSYKMDVGYTVFLGKLYDCNNLEMFNTRSFMTYGNIKVYDRDYYAVALQMMPDYSYCSGIKTFFF